jgi:hypothetical protein
MGGVAVRIFISALDRDAVVSFDPGHFTSRFVYKEVHVRPLAYVEGGICGFSGQQITILNEKKI